MTNVNLRGIASLFVFIMVTGFCAPLAAIAAPIPALDASCVSVTAPAIVKPGAVFMGYVTVKNTGTTRWSSSQQYLTSLTKHWSISKVNLISLVSQGQKFKFSIGAIAPTSSGIYAFSWRMSDRNGKLFGATCSASVIVQAPEAKVVSRFAFYNNSAFDPVSKGDSAAIATDKKPLFNDQIATFVNYTSYSKGINGIIIDIQNLTTKGQLSPYADFAFRVGNDNNVSAWPTVAVPSIYILRGFGVSSSDRVFMTWPDNLIEKQWLQVTVKATANTGLKADDIFYFGNAVGEIGNSTLNAFVDGSDFSGARDYRTLNASITNKYDFNRDGKVNTTDMSITSANVTNSQTALKLLNLKAPIALSADLSLTKQGPATVMSGTGFAYTVKVTNLGPHTAENVKVTDTFPAGLQYMGSSLGDACTASGNSIICNAGSLIAKGQTIISLSFMAPAVACGTSLKNVASVASTTADPILANNSNVSSPVITKVLCADLTISQPVLSNDVPVTCGGNIKFLQTPTFVSGKAADVSGVTVYANIPQLSDGTALSFNLTFSSDTCNLVTEKLPGSTIPESVVKCTNLPLGQPVEIAYAIPAKVQDQAVFGYHTFVTSSLPDPVMGNNAGDVHSTTVSCKAPRQLGDVNNDGLIDALDLDLIAKHINGIAQIPAADLPYADVQRWEEDVAPLTITKGDYYLVRGKIRGVVTLPDLYGDVQQDQYNLVEALDAQRIQRYLLGLMTFSPRQLYVGDVDVDGIITDKDVQLVLKNSVALITELPVTCGNSILENGTNDQPNWGEQCDDGNTENGDGCSSMCTIEQPVCDPSTFSAAVTSYVNRGFVTAANACTLLGTTASRQEFIRFLVEINGGILNPVPAQPSFDDVPVSSPYFRYVEEAAKERWATGDGGCLGTHPCTFRPLDVVKRSEFAVMAQQAFRLEGSLLAPGAADNPAGSAYHDDVQRMIDACAFSVDSENSVFPESSMTWEKMLEAFFHIDRGDEWGVQCTNPGNSFPVCDNGTIEIGEQCDDGNIVNGDGCSATCQSEARTISPMVFQDIQSLTSVDPADTANIGFGVTEVSGQYNLGGYDRGNWIEGRIVDTSGAVWVEVNWNTSKEIDIALKDEAGIAHMIYLPQTTYGNDPQFFWIASDGSSYYTRRSHDRGWPDLTSDQALWEAHLARKAP
ncbi:MAG: dockerin type I domain-containing protein [Candidatus Peregrinibacteria bacterium]